METKDITTLGRGASDTTAVALAAALNAEICEIYTDVDGIFTADPRIVPMARRIPRISYEEMLEMCASGAKVLHLRCVEYARRYGMPIHVRSSFSTKPGTWVGQLTEGERRGAGDHRRGRPRPQRGEDHRRSACLTRWARQRGSSSMLAEAGINIDMIVQNVSAAATGRTDISFTLPRDDGQHAMETLTAIQAEVGFEGLQYDDHIGKVSLVGAGMRTHPGVTRQVLRRPRLGRGQHRDDLHVRDPDLGDRRRGPSRRRGRRRAQRLRPGRDRRRGRRLRRHRHR